MSEEHFNHIPHAQISVRVTKELLVIIKFDMKVLQL